MSVLRRSLHWIVIAPIAGVVAWLVRSSSSAKRSRLGAKAAPVGLSATRVVPFKPHPGSLRRSLEAHREGAIVLPFRPRASARLEESDPPARTGAL